MRIFVFLFFMLSLALESWGQVDRIELGYQTTRRGIVWYRSGLPTHKPAWKFSRDTNAVMWHDTLTAIRYDFDYSDDVWRAKGTFSGAVPPLARKVSGSTMIDNRTAYWIRDTFNLLHKYDSTANAWTPWGDFFFLSTVPADIAVSGTNGAAKYRRSLWQDSDDNQLYYYDGAAWVLVGSGAGDDWGSQTAETDATIDGDGLPGTPLKIAQQGATSGQVLKWNGSTWLPANDTDTDTDAQNLTITGSASPYTVDISGGTDVNVASGTGIGLSESPANTLVITNTAPDQTVSITNGGGVAVSGTYPNFTLTASDQSATNEAWTIDGDDADTELISNQIVKFQGAGISTTDYDPATNTLIITSTEVDGSVTNEGILGVGSGGATSSTIITNTGGSNAVTINAAGILTITESTSSNGGSITITGTEADGSTTNELQTLSNTSTATTHTVTLSNSGGSVQLIEGSNITLTTGGTTSAGTVTIAATGGGVTGAENGVSLSGANVRLGGNLIIPATSIDGDGNELRFFDGKYSLSSWTFASSPTQFMRIQSQENLPTILTSPTNDGIVEFRLHSSAGAEQPNSLTIGGYTTDADGIWLQSRSHSNPSFEYPLSLQPRGGQMSVGRTSGLDALVTFAGTGLAGSTVAGSVLHIENNEGNGKAAMSMGIGQDAMDSEVAWFDATDALRITNRSNTAGTSSVRIAVGGETADKVIITPTSASSSARMGVGYTSTTGIHSTVQSAGSYAGNVIVSSSAVTLDETQFVRIFSGSTNTTWTLPAASGCFGRYYVLMHHGSGGTLTLSSSVTKGNASTFNTLSAGEYAHIWSDGSVWRGYKQTSL